MPAHLKSTTFILVSVREMYLKKGEEKYGGEINGSIIESASSIEDG